jgi:outer membrane protein TolC
MSPPPPDSGQDPWGFTVGFNIPIWRQKYRARVREALAREDAAEGNLRQARFDLLSQLEYSVYELDDATRQTGLYKETLIPRGQQALEVTEVSYESGNATFSDLIDAQRELLAFERAYWRFVATRLQRIADLEMYCGGSLP